MVKIRCLCHTSGPKHHPYPPSWPSQMTRFHSHKCHLIKTPNRQTEISDMRRSRWTTFWFRIALKSAGALFFRITCIIPYRMLAAQSLHKTSGPKHPPSPWPWPSQMTRFPCATLVWHINWHFDFPVHRRTHGHRHHHHRPQEFAIMPHLIYSSIRGRHNSKFCRS